MGEHETELSVAPMHTSIIQYCRVFPSLEGPPAMGLICQLRAHLACLFFWCGRGRCLPAPSRALQGGVAQCRQCFFMLYGHLLRLVADLAFRLLSKLSLSRCYMLFPRRKK